MRAAVKNETDYTLSGGVSHNKMLAKLASAQNKPNKQTIVPSSGIPLLMKTLPLRSIRGLGGKFGAEVVRAVMADPSVSGKDEAGLLACDLHSIDQGTLSRHFGGFLFLRRGLLFSFVPSFSSMCWCVCVQVCM